MSRSDDSDGLDINMARTIREFVEKQYGYRQELVEPNLLRTHIANIPFEAFDPWGQKVLPWHLMKLFDSTYFIHVVGPPDNELMAFTAVCRIEVARQLYSVTSPKCPIVIDSRTTYIKQSSRGNEYRLYHPDVQVPYAVMLSVTVNMKVATRKPKPFPDAWKNKMAVPSEPTEKVIQWADVVKPIAGVVCTEHRVWYTDTDTNKHMNYTTYIKFCYDSFCENMLASRYNRPVDHLYRGGVRMFEMSFKQEVVMGDILSVESWEDATCSDAYHFELNKGTITCCFITIRFYNDSQSNL